MCFTLIWISYSFVSFSLFFLPFSSYFPIEIWSKSKLILNPILHFIYFNVISCYFPLFHLSFLLPLFPFLVLSFRFPFIFFNCPFCSTFLCLFLSWSSRCSNLAISLRSYNLAITFCWKRNPGRGIDSFDPNKKNSTKKRTGSQP